MNEAILRGFDFLAADLTDRLRFCNPILSFSKQNDAPLYLARDLSWEFHDQSYSDSLTTVDSDILDSFATRVADISQTIKCDEGVIVMGSKFFAAASFARVDPTALTKTEFREIPDLRCHIAVSDAHTFEQFAQDLVHRVSSVVDSELRLVSDGGLSENCQAALFVLRNCSATSIANLAIYELMAACVGRDSIVYERLLDRFSIELSKDRGRLDRLIRWRLSRLEKQAKLAKVRPPLNLNDSSRKPKRFA